MCQMHLFCTILPLSVSGNRIGKYSADQRRAWMCAHTVRRTVCHLFIFAQEIHQSYLMNALKNNEFLS